MESGVAALCVYAGIGLSVQRLTVLLLSGDQTVGVCYISCVHSVASTVPCCFMNPVQNVLKRTKRTSHVFK